MLTRKSISLFILPALLVVPLSIASANEVRVQTGDLHVSVQDGAVEINSSSTRTRPLSLKERLFRWRIFGSRRPNLRNCQQQSSSSYSTHSSSSGSSVSQSSISSSTTICN